MGSFSSTTGSNETIERAESRRGLNGDCLVAARCPLEGTASLAPRPLTVSRRSLTASRRSLTASRRSLTASRRSLTASRKSLTASRRSLTAFQRSLTASQRSLTASQRSLTASRRSLIASRRPLIHSRRSTSLQYPPKLAAATPQPTTDNAAKPQKTGGFPLNRLLRSLAVLLILTAPALYAAEPKETIHVVITGGANAGTYDGTTTAAAVRRG
jgi:hypothetical protein